MVFVDSDSNSGDFRGPLPSQKWDSTKFHFVEIADFEWCFWTKMNEFQEKNSAFGGVV